MSDHVNPLDAVFLEIEQHHDGAHMHIGGVMVFDPLPEGGAPSIERVREHLAGRLHLLPRYRQRLSSPRTGGLTWPSWEPVAELDLTTHVRQGRLPAPGGDAELLEWVGDFASHRLDRTRPLWEIVLLDGLEDGRWALATKTHHALVDGVGSVDVGHLLLDAEPNPAAPPAPPAPPAEAPAPPPSSESSAWLAGPALFLRGARAGIDTALHPGKLRELADRGRAVAEVLIRDELIAAPTTSINVSVGGTRHYAAIRFSLEELKAIKEELGGTLNDVILTICAGGFRRLLIERGEEPPARGLRAQVPVNIRTAGERLALGNKVSQLFAHLPVAEPDPLARYRSMVADTAALKGSSQAAGGKDIIDLAGLAPPALHAVIARMLLDARLFNVTITNVPGPQIPLYAFGAPMREVLPIVPLFIRHPFGIAVFSYDGGVVLGLNADRGTGPDLDVLATGIEYAFVELQALTGTRSRAPVREPAAS